MAHAAARASKIRSRSRIQNHPELEAEESGEDGVRRPVGIALALSISGLYGVVTYGLSQRTKEIGIRMALGASSARITRLVMAEAGRLVAIGSGVGLVLSFSAPGVLAAIVPLQNVSILNATALLAGTGRRPCRCVRGIISRAKGDPEGSVVIAARQSMARLFQSARCA
jgi:hypothetical protein